MQMTEQGPPGPMRLKSRAARSILSGTTEKLLKGRLPAHVILKLARRMRPPIKGLQDPKSHSEFQSRKEPEK